MVQLLNFKETFIYFIIERKNKKIFYIGQSDNGRSRVHSNRVIEGKLITDKHYEFKIISSEKIKCLNNSYFRKYYETRWIYKFKPEGNKQIIVPPSLNWFLIKMFLWNENPQPLWIVPFSKNCPFKCKFLTHTLNHKKFIFNGYSKVWLNIDTNKTLYVNHIPLFKYLFDTGFKKTLNKKTRKTFNNREEVITN